MTAAALVLAGVLAAVAVIFVARPFLREPALRREADVLEDPGPLEQRQLALAEERDRALAALKELEFDQRTGKVSDEDYRALVGPLRRRAAAALAALEPRAGPTVYPSERMSEPYQPPATPPQPVPVPEPTPVPHEPPQQPDIPEPYPPPATPPEPAPQPGIPQLD